MKNEDRIVEILSDSLKKQDHPTELLNIIVQVEFGNIYPVSVGSSAGDPVWNTSRHRYAQQV